VRICRAANALLRALQERGLFLGRDSGEPLAPGRLAQAEEVLAWVREYLMKDHPELGRSGPVCPYAQRSLASDRLLIAFHEEVDGTSYPRLRSAVLRRSRALAKRLRQRLPGDEHLSVVMLFPALPAQRHVLLDRVHAEMKSALMAREVMISPFHPGSEKPGQHNPDFRASRAPFACVALRPMNVHDIHFVAHNEAAFFTYVRRFGAQYDARRVTNEYGWVDAYRSALGRFAAPAGFARWGGRSKTSRIDSA
jgi:hypothetical protein